MFLEISREVFGTPIFTRTTHEELNDRNTIMKAEVEGKKQASQKGKKQWLYTLITCTTCRFPAFLFESYFIHDKKKRQKLGTSRKLPLLSTFKNSLGTNRSFHRYFNILAMFLTVFSFLHRESLYWAAIRNVYLNFYGNFMETREHISIDKVEKCALLLQLESPIFFFF